MNAQNATRRLEQFERATARLDETLAEPVGTPYIIDATIQRFEFAFELAWKTMRGFLELAGRTVPATPRDAFKAAFAAGWINDEAGWFELMKMSNATSHIYDEAMAKDIYGRIRVHASLLRAAATVLRALP